MTIILCGIAAFLIASLIVALSACALSGQISREEEHQTETRPIL